MSVRSLRGRISIRFGLPISRTPANAFGVQNPRRAWRFKKWFSVWPMIGEEGDIREWKVTDVVRTPGRENGLKNNRVFLARTRVLLDPIRPLVFIYYDVTYIAYTFIKLVRRNNNNNNNV